MEITVMDEYSIEKLEKFLFSGRVGHIAACRIVEEAAGRVSRPGFIPGHRLCDAIHAAVPEMKKVDVATLVVDCHGELADSFEVETVT